MGSSIASLRTPEPPTLGESVQNAALSFYVRVSEIILQSMTQMVANPYENLFLWIIWSFIVMLILIEIVDRCYETKASKYSSEIVVMKEKISEKAAEEEMQSEEDKQSEENIIGEDKDAEDEIVESQSEESAVEMEDHVEVVENEVKEVNSDAKKGHVEISETVSKEVRFEEEKNETEQAEDLEMKMLKREVDKVEKKTGLVEAELKNDETNLESKDSGYLSSIFSIFSTSPQQDGASKQNCEPVVEPEISTTFPETMENEVDSKEKVHQVDEVDTLETLEEKVEFLDAEITEDELSMKNEDDVKASENEVEEVDSFDALEEKVEVVDAKMMEEELTMKKQDHVKASENEIETVEFEEKSKVAEVGVEEINDMEEKLDVSVELNSAVKSHDSKAIECEVEKLEKECVMEKTRSASIDRELWASRVNHLMRETESMVASENYAYHDIETETIKEKWESKEPGFLTSFFSAFTSPRPKLKSEEDGVVEHEEAREEPALAAETSDIATKTIEDEVVVESDKILMKTLENEDVSETANVVSKTSEDEVSIAAEKILMKEKERQKRADAFKKKMMEESKVDESRDNVRKLLQKNEDDSNEMAVFEANVREKWNDILSRTGVSQEIKHIQHDIFEDDKQSSEIELVKQNIFHFPTEEEDLSGCEPNSSEISIEPKKEKVKEKKVAKKAKSEEKRKKSANAKKMVALLDEVSKKLLKLKQRKAEKKQKKKKKKKSKREQKSRYESATF